MRRSRIPFVLFLAATSGSVIACSAGTGPSASLGDPYDRPPSSREIPPDTFQKPGASGGGAGEIDACALCSGTFRCVLPPLGQGSEAQRTPGGGTAASLTLVLRTVGGQCAVVGKDGVATVTRSCRNWEATSTTSFTMSFGSTATFTKDGVLTSTTGAVKATCTKESESTEPVADQDRGGEPENGSGNNTPPAMNPAPIVDAGTSPDSG